MATIVSTTPHAPIVFDKEKKITWDEISPSLQEKFNRLNIDVLSDLNNISSLFAYNRVTIGANPPSDPNDPPIPNREIWFDTTENSLKFYMSRNEDNNYAWETTKAAWYGGSSKDTSTETATNINYQWSLIKTLAWVSNPAVNNTFSTVTDIPTTEVFYIAKAGTYLFRDMSYLFPYNKQAAYTHDGGKITVKVVNETTGATILNQVYDSQTTFCAYNYTNKTYPEKTVTLTANTKLRFTVTINRNPLSTDDIDIYISAGVFIYRLNYGNASDSSPDLFLNSDTLDIMYHKVV